MILAHSYTQNVNHSWPVVVHSRICCFLQNVYYTSTQQLHIGILSPTIDDDDNKCLVDVNSRLRIIECSYATAKRMKLQWLFTQVTLNETALTDKKKKKVYNMISVASSNCSFYNVAEKATVIAVFKLYFYFFCYGPEVSNSVSPSVALHMQLCIMQYIIWNMALIIDIFLTAVELEQKWISLM